MKSKIFTILSWLLVLHVVVAHGVNRLNSMPYPGENGKIYNVSLSRFKLIMKRMPVYKSPSLYLYFNGRSPGVPVESDYMDELKRHKYKSVHLKLLAHGWRGDRYSKSVEVLKEAYLSQGAIVGVIDWSSVASLPLPIATKWIEKLADDIRPNIEGLVTSGFVKANQLHLVGYGLGAHLVGLIGKKSCTTKIFAITGLDPTQPFFELNQPDKRLDKMDAKYVEVIHTSYANFLGFKREIGDADFYVNGGDVQPSCGQDLYTCPHSLSYKVYAEAIKNPEDFHAYPCDSFSDLEFGRCNEQGEEAQMGGVDLKLTQGIYNVKYEPTTRRHTASLLDYE